VFGAEGEGGEVVGALLGDDENIVLAVAAGAILYSTSDPMGAGWAYRVRDSETGRDDSGLVDNIDQAQQSIVNILVSWGADEGEAASIAQTALGTDDD
jgi:hypothetical protein